MKTKNIAVIALAAALVLLLWYRVVYSSMSSQASKANQAAQDAEVRAKSLETQLRAEGGTSSGGTKSHKASVVELQNAIPATPAVSDFLRSADAVGSASGVVFQSIVPSQPTLAAGIASMNFGITVQGSYAQVRSYVDGLMALPRLVVIDSASLSAGQATTGAAAATAVGGPVGDVFAGTGAAPVISLQLTARVFTQQLPVAPAAGGAGTATPSAGAAAPSSSTGVSNS